MESQKIPDMNLPFGQIRTFNNFKEHLSLNLELHLSEKDILVKETHKFTYDFKQNLISFLKGEILKYFPGPGEWALQIATETVFTCIAARASCEGCGESVSCEILREENMKKFVFNMVLAKIFDYEIGIMPRLFGLKPLVSTD